MAQPPSMTVKFPGIVEPRGQNVVLILLVKKEISTAC